MTTELRKTKAYVMNMLKVILIRMSARATLMVMMILVATLRAQEMRRPTPKVTLTMRSRSVNHMEDGLEQRRRDDTVDDDAPGGVDHCRDDDQRGGCRGSCVAATAAAGRWSWS